MVARMLQLVKDFQIMGSNARLDKSGELGTQVLPQNQNKVPFNQNHKRGGFPQHLVLLINIS